MRYSELNKDSINMREFDDLVFTDCQSFLKQTNSLLYRGTYEINPMRVHVPNNRRPRDTLPVIHEVYEIAFRNMGFDATRSNSFFCSGSESTTSDYGYASIVFPIGYFDFTWSPIVYDMLDYSTRLKRRLTAAQEQVLDPKTKDKLIHEVMSFIADTRYSFKDLNAAIKSNNEIMISCDSFYSISLSDFNEHDVFPKIDAWLKNKRHNQKNP